LNYYYRPMFKTYFPKRYFAYFGVLFIVWYTLSLLFFGVYSATEDVVISLAQNMLFPTLIFILTFFYMRSSVNDWNDRFAVAVGWSGLSLVLAGMLSKPMYGFDWSMVVNPTSVTGLWIPMVVSLFGSLAQVWYKKRK